MLNKNTTVILFFLHFFTFNFNLFVHLRNGFTTCLAPDTLSSVSNCTFNTCIPAGGNTPIAAKPRLQLKEDSYPCRCAEHRNGKSSSCSHPVPSKPASHRHTPSMQSPRIEQSLGHLGSLQSMPVKSGSHKQLSATHFPLPEQKL